MRINWVMNNKAIVIEVATKFTNKIFGVNKSSSEKITVQVDFQYSSEPVLKRTGKDNLHSWAIIKKLKYIEVMIAFPSGDELSYFLPISSSGLVNPHKW